MPGPLSGVAKPSLPFGPWQVEQDCSNTVAPRAHLGVGQRERRAGRQQGDGKRKSGQGKAQSLVSRCRPV